MASEFATLQFLKHLINNDFKSAKGLTTSVSKELNHLPPKPKTASLVQTIRDLLKDVKQERHGRWKDKFRGILGDITSKLIGPLEEARKDQEEVVQLPTVTRKKQDKPPSKLQGASPKTLKPSSKAENTNGPSGEPISSHASNTANHPASGKKKLTGVTTTQQQGIANGMPRVKSASKAGRQPKPASASKVGSKKDASFKVSQGSVKKTYMANSSSKHSQKSPSENHRSFPETETSFSSSQQQPSEMRESRLKESKYVSHALSYNNPNIADLSDPNRPTKLAEKYSELYDNEWTEAFEAMSKLKAKHLLEADITGLLLEIVEEAYKFCLEEADKLRTDILKEIEQKKPGESELSLEELAQMVELKKQKAEASVSNLQKPGKSELSIEELAQVVELKKQEATASVSDLQNKFCDNNLRGICTTKKLNAPSIDGATARYAKRTVELMWWMCIQDPLVHMVTSDTEFDPRLYKAYTKSGSKPDYFVWPPLKHYKEGDLLTKGVVQYM